MYKTFVSKRYYLIQLSHFQLNCMQINVYDKRCELTNRNNFFFLAIQFEIFNCLIFKNIGFHILVSKKSYPSIYYQTETFKQIQNPIYCKNHRECAIFLTSHGVRVSQISILSLQFITCILDKEI